jgi:hypothetical protein
MCLRRAPVKYITGAMAPVGAALDRAGVALQFIVTVVGSCKLLLLIISTSHPWFPVSRDS